MHAVSDDGDYRLTRPVSTLIAPRFAALSPHAGARIPAPPTATRVAPSTGWTAKQCVQLRRVLGQPVVTHLCMPELALDHPERVFDLGPNARLGVLPLAHDRAHGRDLVQHIALARGHGHVPIDIDLVSSRFSTP